MFLRATGRATAATATSSKALWEVEVVKDDPCRGGRAQWDSLFRFKHLATGAFLSTEVVNQVSSILAIFDPFPNYRILSQIDNDVTPDPIRNKLRGNLSVYYLTPHTDDPDRSCLFELHPTTSVKRGSSIPKYIFGHLICFHTALFTNICLTESRPSPDSNTASLAPGYTAQRSPLTKRHLAARRLETNRGDQSWRK